MDDPWLLLHVRLIQIQPLSPTPNTRHASKDLKAFIGCCNDCIALVRKKDRRLLPLLFRVIHQYVVVVCDPMIARLTASLTTQTNRPANRNTNKNTRAEKEEQAKAKEILDIVKDRDKLCAVLKKKLPHHRYSVDAAEICKQWYAVNIFEVASAAIGRGWKDDKVALEELIEKEEAIFKRRRKANHKTKTTTTKGSISMKQWFSRCKSSMPAVTCFEFTDRTVASSAPKWQCFPIQQWEWDVRRRRFDELEREKFEIASELTRAMEGTEDSTQSSHCTRLQDQCRKIFSAPFDGRCIRTIDSQGRHKVQCRHCNRIYGDVGLVVPGSEVEVPSRGKIEEYKPWQCAEAGLWGQLSISLERWTNTKAMVHVKGVKGARWTFVKDSM